MIGISISIFAFYFFFVLNSPKTKNNKDNKKESHQSVKPTPSKFDVFVRTLTGKLITIEVDGTCTIAQIKQKINEQLETIAEKQRLVFAGKQLEDHRSLDDYGIAKESTIHWVMTGCIGRRQSD